MLTPCGYNFIGILYKEKFAISIKILLAISIKLCKMM
ncbi:hypothetical protein CHY_1861 [Carboxydothermus hydrogenoformans Z-2901]|uniref:Uncharacterized protein n=1 Tax=Carboxydothermus hydrogenoformans (strain ATCC BAA-161 / DSM 6008 / Z-2901) TaxID=246194 RepID=Q3AB03_CARHZ|nr:hypothetical protein CHY_1861 [Carboxydothermus hydrogenoformans Z-2901]